MPQHNTGPVEHHYVHFEIVGVTATTIRRLFTKPFALSPDPHTDALAAAVRAPPGQAEVVCRAKAAVYAALASALAALHERQHRADRLGFANRYHLTRAFTRRVGIPPAAYRNTRHA